MQLAADAVVFLTGMPIAGGLIVGGLADHRVAEIGAGLILVVILGAPSVAIAIRNRVRRGA